MDIRYAECVKMNNFAHCKTLFRVQLSNNLGQMAVLNSLCNCDILPIAALVRNAL